MYIHVQDMYSRCQTQNMLNAVGLRAPGLLAARVQCDAGNFVLREETKPLTAGAGRLSQWWRA